MKREFYMTKEERTFIQEGNWLNERKEMELTEIIDRIELQWKTMKNDLEYYPDLVGRECVKASKEYAEIVLHYLYNRIE